MPTVNEKASPEEQPATSATGASASIPLRHALRDQETLWAEFLTMGRSVVESLAKSVTVLCDGCFDVVPEVKQTEKDSDSAEVRIEQECLRVLALFEPVASDLRRLATILKVSRDWERIADLAARIAQRMRKLARKPDAAAVPEPLKLLARAVLAQVRDSYVALAGRDASLARAVIKGDRSIDRDYHRVRNELKDSIRRHPEQLESWLQLMSTARNIERIADHSIDVAQSVVYLQEGMIIRHKGDH
jgi:phosphate transport system protein